MVNVKLVKEISNEKVMEPDTIEELIEAMKILDKNKDGQILVPELRYAMSKLGDCMDEPAVDDMIKEVDGDNKGFVDIMEFAKCCFAIKEKKSKDWLTKYTYMLNDNFIKLNILIIFFKT